MTELDNRALPSDCPRRTVLQGALALGAAGVLAACGGSSSSHDTAQQPAAPAGGGDTGGSTPTTVASPTQSETAASSSGGGSVLGPASDVPVGGGKIYGGPKIVVTQPTSGTYKAFSAVCTHESCTVADVDGGTINCPCHGSKFNISDGSVVHGPAGSPLPSKNVTVSGGNVTLTA